MEFIEFNTFILYYKNNKFTLDAYAQLKTSITKGKECYLISTQIIPDNFERQCVLGFDKIDVIKNIRKTNGKNSIETFTIEKPVVKLISSWKSKNKISPNGLYFMITIKKEYR